MRAFHNDESIKATYLARVAHHRAADELIQGTGWAYGKGCAVGCTLEAYDHKRYPVELGIPEVLAHLEDKLFELLPGDDAMRWPERFLSAPRVGADLSAVWPDWAVWMLTDPVHGVIQHAGDNAAVRATIDRVADCWRRRAALDEFGEAAREAAWAAEAVARAAWAAAETAVWAAGAAWAARAAWAAWRAAAGDDWTRAACDKLIALMEAS